MGNKNKTPIDKKTADTSLPFIIMVEISSDLGQFKIGTAPDVKYNYNVDSQCNGKIDARGITGDYTCTFQKPGTYKVSIHDNTGTDEGFPQVNFESDKEKLIGIIQWGTGKWTSFAGAFSGCANLSDQGGAATDQPNLSNVTDMSRMFDGAAKFNQDIRNWNTSGVTNMSALFRGAKKFNQYIGDWDTSSVTDMSEMFYEAMAFNQPIGKWNTSNVTNMHHMFYYNDAFRESITAWDLSKVVGPYKRFSGVPPGVGRDG